MIDEIFNNLTKLLWGSAKQQVMFEGTPLFIMVYKLVMNYHYFMLLVKANEEAKIYS